MDWFDFLVWLIGGYARFLAWFFLFALSAMIIVALIEWRAAVDRKELKRLRDREAVEKAKREAVIRKIVSNGTR